MATRSTMFLMANLGSAMLRAYSSHEKKDQKTLEQYSEECYAIIDQIIRNKDSVGGAAEALMIKNILSQLKNPASRLNVTRKEIESYFLPFSILVAQRQNK